MSTAEHPVGASFKRTTRAVAGIASAGVVAGISMVAAAPASAAAPLATDADCTLDNTVATGDGADIQALLDADTAIVCLSGTFELTTGLTFDHTLTLYGLSSAVLDGGEAVSILRSIPYAGADLAVQNIRFTGGFADYSQNGDDEGGAIQAHDVTVRNSQFDNNVADWRGGAISAYSADVQNSTFSGNFAYAGGAIAAQYGVTVAESTFTDNIADGEGGAIKSYGTVDVQASTFDHNGSRYSGGAIVGRSAVTVNNSTFVANETGEFGGGGAVALESGSVTFSTFLGNVSPFGTSLQSGGPVDLFGNVFASDTPTVPHLYAYEAPFTDAGSNLFSTPEDTETGLTPAANSAFGVTTALLFGGAGLADNGGPTQTVALYSGSPAVGFVQPNVAFDVQSDQRGVARGAVSDAGAFTFVAPKPALAATGSETPVGLIGGFAALLLALGATVLGVTRRAH